MLCEVCGRKEAEKQLNKIINGNLKTLYVCKECFYRGGEMLSSKDRVCPRCGRSLAQINATLIVGCPDCYNAFKEELQTIIRQVQQL